LSFIDQHAKSISLTHGFTELSKDRLCVILSSSKLCIKEVDLFLAVVRWGRAECKRNNKPLDSNEHLKAVLSDVLPLIRFPLFSVSEFSLNVQPLNLLSSEHLLQLYTYIAIKDNKDAVLPKVPFICEPRASICFAFTWVRCGDSGRIESRGMKVISTRHGYCYAIANKPIQPYSGRYYWECRIDNLGTNADWQCGFGVCLGSADNSLIGWYYFNHGIRSHSNKTDRYGQPMATGDIIGVLFESDSGKLSFYRNKKSLGFCFDGINQQIYPVCQINYPCSVSIVSDAYIPS